MKDIKLTKSELDYILNSIIQLDLDIEDIVNTDTVKEALDYVVRCNKLRE